jgi:hypothetical protein
MKRRNAGGEPARAIATATHTTWRKPPGCVRQDKRGHPYTIVCRGALRSTLLLMFLHYCDELTLLEKTHQSTQE